MTGGSGFIGSHVVDALLGAGCEVRVLDRRAPHRDDVEWVDIDVLEQDALTDALKGTGPVFHLAAMADVNEVVAEPAESVATTALGAARVLEAARRADAGRVILASTVWVYAAAHGDVVDEDTPFDLTARAPHLRVEQARGGDVLRRLRQLVRAALHRPALRHPVRAAHAQRPRDRIVHRTGAARRAAPHRR